MAKRIPDPNAVVSAISAIPDPAERGAAATKALEDLATAQENLKAVRQEAVGDLVYAGWTFDEIGKAIGVTRGRAYQISKGMSGSTAKS